MRITNMLTLKTNIKNYQKSSFDVNQTIQKLSSKLKINETYEDSSIFSSSTRLDYEIAILKQVQETGTKASEFTKNSDSALGDMVELLTTFRTKLIQAANNGVHDPTSLNAIANDLQGIRNNLVQVANTSINGQYLFSGTALDVKPISDDGAYHGNDQILKAIMGHDQMLPQNIDGKTLFFGRDNDYKKITTTNVSMMNNREKLLDNDKEVYMNETSKIYELIGKNYRSPLAQESDWNLDYDRSFEESNLPNLPDTTFFIRGKKVTGETFSAKFSMTADSTMQELLDSIGRALGNTDNSKVVNVILNDSAQIEVTDLKTGNLLSDFNIFGLTAMEGMPSETTLFTQADIENLVNQDDINQAIKDGNVYLTEIIKSPNYQTFLEDESMATDFDRLAFGKKDNKITSNISQVIRDTNEYATNSTKLVDVAGSKIVDANGNRIKDANGNYITPDLTQDQNGNQIHKNITMQIRSNNNNLYQAKVEFVGSGSDAYPVLTISELDANANVVTDIYTGNIYTGKYDAFTKQTEGVKVGANELTYQNLNDIISVISSGQIEDIRGTLENINSTAQADITAAYERFNGIVKEADNYVHVELNDRGQIDITDKTRSVSNIQISMYEDTNGNDFPPAVGLHNASNGTIFSFNGNNAITIDDASVNFFADLDDMIEAVRNDTYRADWASVDPRSAGVQGAIKRIDHILDHIDKQHALIGSYTNVFIDSNQRSKTLEVNVETVKDGVIGVDLGELALEFQQRLIGFQTQLMSAGRISQISLLNYL